MLSWTLAASVQPLRSGVFSHFESTPAPGPQCAACRIDMVVILACNAFQVQLSRPRTQRLACRYGKTSRSDVSRWATF